MNLLFSCDCRPSSTFFGHVIVAAIFLLGTFAGCGIFADPDPIVGEESNKTQDFTMLSEQLPGIFSEHWKNEAGDLINFCISVPESYTYDTGPAAPLVLSLHYGADRYPENFGQTMLTELTAPGTGKLDPIIVAPNVVNDTWNDFRCQKLVTDLVKKICETYRVDRSKILVVGYSMGGEGAWSYASRYPDLFTASIPISGHPPANYLDMEWKVPILAINSRKDEIYTYKTVSDAVLAMQNRNLPVQLYTLEDISHYDSSQFVKPLKEATNWVAELWGMDLEASGQIKQDPEQLP